MPPHPPISFAVPGDLAAPTGGYGYDRKLIAALRDAGTDVTHLPLPDGFPFPDGVVMSSAFDRMAGVPDTHALIVDGLAYGALDTDRLNGIAAPIVALVHHPLAHESGLARADADRLRALERANLALAEHVLVPSPHIRDLLVADYGTTLDRVTVLRPGRPEAPVRLLRPRDSPPDPLILSVGLLHPRKGHDVLIDALARIAELRWRAVIAGPAWAPDHARELAKQIDHAGLAGRVDLAGHISTDQLNSLYQAAELFALATRYEGYGMVFDEAMTHGLPIVATRVGAVPGTVPEDVSLLVPPDDPAAFATALGTLLRDPDLRRRKAEAAHRAAIALPDWNDAAVQVMNLVKGIMHRRRPTRTQKG